MKTTRKSKKVKVRPGFIWSKSQRRFIRSRSTDSAKDSGSRGNPTYGIVLPTESVQEILRSKSSIVRWGPRAGINPLPKEAEEKPCYLIGKDGDGRTAILGIGKPSRIYANKTRIKSLRKFPTPKAVKLLGNPNTRGPVIKRSLLEIQKPPAEKDEAKDQGALHKILSDDVGDPIADAGAHRHWELIRNEARVFSSGNHFHKVLLEDGRVLVTDIDGAHPHGLDGELATAEGSEHSHTLGLPEDIENGAGFVKSDISGEHTQVALTQSTGFGGTHTHEFNINGKIFVTLTTEEESMMLAGGIGDDPNGIATGPLQIMGLAESLGIETEEGNIQKAIDDIMKQTSVQTVVLSRQRFSTAEDSKAWVKENGFKSEKVDVKPNTFRFRQFSEKLGKKGTFRTVRPRGTKGIQFIICVKKAPESPKGEKSESQSAEEIEKRRVEESKIRIHKTSLGFESFILKGDILFATDQKASGKRSGKIILAEIQRMDGDAMNESPGGAKEAILVEEVKGNPKKLAEEHLGRRIFVMEKVGERLVEKETFLAVLDPRKEEHSCTCGAKSGS